MLYPAGSALILILSCQSVSHSEKLHLRISVMGLKYRKVLMIKLIFAAFAASLLFGCGNPGFSTTAGPTDGSTTAPNPVLPGVTSDLKSTGIEVVTGAAVNVTGQRGSKASISIGDVSSNKLKSANGYQVFLSVSGQSASAQ